MAIKFLKTYFQGIFCALLAVASHVSDRTFNQVVLLCFQDFQGLSRFIVRINGFSQCAFLGLGTKKDLAFNFKGR